MSGISGPQNTPSNQPAWQNLTTQNNLSAQDDPQQESLDQLLNEANAGFQDYFNDVLSDYKQNPSVANAKRIVSMLQEMEGRLFGDAGLVKKMHMATLQPNTFQNLNKAISQLYSLGYQLTLAEQKITDYTDKNFLPPLTDLLNVMGDGNSKTDGSVWGDFNLVCNYMTQTGNSGPTMDSYPDPDYSVISGSNSLERAQSAIKNIQDQLKKYQDTRQSWPLISALVTAQGLFGYSVINYDQGFPGFIADLESQNQGAPTVSQKKAIEQAYSLQSRISDAELLIRTNPHDYSTLDQKIKYIVDDMQKITNLLS